MIPLATKDLLTVKAAPSTRDVSAAWPQSASPDTQFSLESEAKGPTTVARQDQRAKAAQQDAAGTASDVEVACSSAERHIQTLAQAPNSTSKQTSDLATKEHETPDIEDNSFQDLGQQISQYDSIQSAFLPSNAGSSTATYPDSSATSFARITPSSQTADPSISAASAWPADGKTERDNDTSGVKHYREVTSVQGANVLTPRDVSQNGGRQMQQTPTGSSSGTGSLATNPETMAMGGDAATSNPPKNIAGHPNTSALGTASSSGSRLEPSISQDQVSSGLLKPAFQGLPENSAGLTHDRTVAMPKQPAITNLTTSIDAAPTLPAAASATQVSGADQHAAPLQNDTRHILAHVVTIQPDTNGGRINAPQARGAYQPTAQTDTSTTTQPAPQLGVTPQPDGAREAGVTRSSVQVSAIRTVESGSMNAGAYAPKSGPASVNIPAVEPALSRDPTVGEMRSNVRPDRLARVSSQASASHSQMNVTPAQATGTTLSTDPQAIQNIAARIQNDETGFDAVDDATADTLAAAHATTAARGEATGNINSTAPTMPQSVSRQVAAAVVQMADQPVEIALSPEELGKVRLVLHASEHGMVVTVQAERPETLDLMRRNIGMLATDMRDLGYSELSFTFSDHPQQQSGQAQSDAVAQGLSSGENRNVETAAPILTPPKPSRDANASGLDLRI